MILGAGCAGLSLCHYLLERGVDAPILILDRKKTFADDRTWCFWEVEETPFSGRALRRWNSWSVRAGGREVIHTSSRYPYLCLTGADFYEDALGKISTHGNVTVRLGEDVRSCKELDDGVLVVTSSGSYLADRVFDGRGLPPDSAVLQEARRGGTWISQQFLGWRLRARRPVFDPGSCTLMDFSVDQGQGLRFAYVLPFDEHEALVENVYLTESGAPPETQALALVHGEVHEGAASGVEDRVAGAQAPAEELLGDPGPPPTRLLEDRGVRREAAPVEHAISEV